MTLLDDLKRAGQQVKLFSQSETITGMPDNEVVLRANAWAAVDPAHEKELVPGDPVVLEWRFQKALDLLKLTAQASERLLDTDPEIRSRAHTIARHDAYRALRAVQNYLWRIGEEPF